MYQKMGGETLGLLEDGLCWSGGCPHRVPGCLWIPACTPWPPGCPVPSRGSCPVQEAAGMWAEGLDPCHSWDGLCARAGLVARAGGCAKPGFGLGAVREGSGRSPGRDKGAAALLQPQPALPRARGR